MSHTEEYGEEEQRVLLSFMVSDPTSFALSQNIIKADYFDDHLRPAVRYILEYADKYKALPEPVQIKASTKVDIDKFPEVIPAHAEWYLKTVEGFCKHRALEMAVLDGVDLLQKGEAGELYRRMNDAMTISLLRDLGTGYFNNPLDRLTRMQENSDFISTGWKIIDDKLYGGFTPGSLNIFAGGSGSGKSLFLQNIALNWAFMGKRVIYITLELAEDLVALRMDAMVTDSGTAEIRRDIRKAAARIAIIAKDKKPGDLKIKKFPEAGTTANDLRAYLKEYEIQEGHRPDALVVDYLDLMHPNNAKIDVSSLFTKDKYVSEELRSIGSEWNIPVVSASQLNRQSIDAQEFDHSHIAGGISKINTADNVFGIFTSAHMKERGIYHLQFLKTRSASAVGQRIELAYNNSSMRILDPVVSSEDQQEVKSSTMAEVQAALKAKIAGAQTPPPASMSQLPISQQAHPQHLSREEIVAKGSSASPAKSRIGDLMKQIRGGPET